MVPDNIFEIRWSDVRLEIRRIRWVLTPPLIPCLFFSTSRNTSKKVQVSRCLSGLGSNVLAGRHKDGAKECVYEEIRRIAGSERGIPVILGYNFNDEFEPWVDFCYLRCMQKKGSAPPPFWLFFNIYFQFF